MPKNPFANANSAGKARRAPFGGKKGGEFYKAVPLDEDGNPCEVSTADKAKGAAQMAAGTVITAAGIPMMILPGPGVAAIVGGAALTLKGHRTMTGRDPMPIEQSIDDAAGRMASKAKEEATAAGKKVARKASEAGAKIAEQGPSVVFEAASHAPEAVASAVSRAPEVVADVASQAPEVAEKLGRVAVRGAKVAAAVGSEAARQGAEILRERKAAKDER